MSSSNKLASALAWAALACGVTGCLIDDTARPHGQAAGPSASVPNSGSPVRRESPTKTLRDADAERAAVLHEGGAELNVEPAPGETPAPPPPAQ
jgi:hypothetical protein